jgi:hypothetical protein
MEKCGLTCDTMGNVLFDIMGARIHFGALLFICNKS